MSKKTAITTALIVIMLTALALYAGENPLKWAFYGFLGMTVVALYNPISAIIIMFLLIGIPAGIETKTWIGSAAVVLCAFGAFALYIAPVIYCGTHY